MSTFSQKPIYESFKMFHPNGTFMGYTSQKKFSYYVRNNLATQLDSNSFKFNFEPKGMGGAENPYFTQPLANRCVVCGATDKPLNKHHVVPYVFRSRFPLEIKKSNHHDVLAVCLDCHEAYEQKANVLKEQLAQEHNTQYINNHHIERRKILSARQLLASDKVLPPKARKKLELLAAMDPEQFVNWADVVIKSLDSREKIQSFVTAWRQHFIDSVKPGFLPQYWSVSAPLTID